MPRLSPHLSSTPAISSSDARLPDDVVADQLRRLEAFALVCVGLWGVGLLMDAVVYPLAVGTGRTDWRSMLIEGTAVFLAVAMYVWVRRSTRAPATKADAGLWLMLVNAAAIALLETWATDPTRLMLGHLSWTAIVILLSAMIVPMPPRTMLFGSLVAASLAPFGVWLAYLRGVDTPSPLETLLMYMPSYSCAVAAVIPARMFQRMGRRLKEARDLGSYQLEDRLGEGGMGEVWRARHRFLARPAAIKLVRPEMLGVDSGSKARIARQRFEAEAQVTASLTSPHTVRLFDFGVAEDGRFYYVMELLDGLDLGVMVQQFGPLPAPRVVHVLRQVCHSLAEAHARGLVHRDVKPANVFLCRSGLDADVAKVLDFGLVHSVTRDAGNDLTLSADGLGGPVGTPAFMAPEMIRGADVDARADVYALGCLVHFLLTGRPVFDGATTMQVLLAHVGTPPQPPSRRAAGAVPPWLDALVLACLEKDPAKRPASVSNVLARVALGGGPPWSSADAWAWWDAHAPAPIATTHVSGDDDVTRHHA